MVNMCTLFGPLRMMAVGGIWLGLGLAIATGQISGSRATDPGGGVEGETLLPPEIAMRYIMIRGTAERALPPSELRLIWAITTEDAEPPRCRELLRQQVDAVREAWRPLGISPDQIVEDFISAIPRFEWQDEVRGDVTLLVEKRTGYRVQTNLHVRAQDDRHALQIVDAALAAGVTDLIGVDYLADLTEIQVETRRAALEAARAKSQLLLAPLFSEMPQPINLTEQTRVRHPDQQYVSFQNVAADEYQGSYGDNRRRIFAYRPKNTYYRGSTGAADDRIYELPMSPKIVVESTVQIYYLSPAAQFALPASDHPQDLKFKSEIVPLKSK